MREKGDKRTTLTKSICRFINLIRTKKMPMLPKTTVNMSILCNIYMYSKVEVLTFNTQTFA